MSSEKMRTTFAMTTLAIVTTVGLITAASLTHLVLGVSSSDSTSLKKFFDCVSKKAKNGTPSRADVDKCYDTTYPSSGVSTSVSVGKGGAAAAASAGTP